MKSQIISLVFLICMVFAVNCAVNQKKGTLQYDTTTNGSSINKLKNLLQTGTRYCKGDLIADAAQCTQFYSDCSVCFTQDFLFSCFWMCDETGTCGGNTCPSVQEGMCSFNMDLCNTCFQTWSQCSCPTGTYTVIDTNYGQTCEILPCPFGTFQPDPNCSDCTPCDDSCNGCFGPANDQCVFCNEVAGYCNYYGACVNPLTFQCDAGFFMISNDQGCFDCTSVCPVYMWGNPVTGKCENCPTGCPFCTSADTCQSPCDAGFCFFGDLCQPLDFQCPPGTFKIQSDPSSCFDCVDECVQCPDGSFCDNQNHVCSTNCDGYIVDKQCLTDCPLADDGSFQYFTPVPYSYPEVYQCVTCDLCPSNAYCDNIANTCTPCNYPSFMFQGNCIDSCPAGFFLLYDLNGVPFCYKDCPPTMYGDVNTWTCQACNYPCLSCVDNADKCTFPCASNFFFYQFQCVPSCPFGTYEFGHTDPNQAICLDGESCFCGDCHPTCKTCNGGLSTNCITCQDGLWLTTEGQCVPSCPYGTYPREDGFCQCCHSLCTQCTGPQVNQCGGCIPGALFDETTGTCFESWDVQAYTSSQVVEQGVTQTQS